MSRLAVVLVEEFERAWARAEADRQRVDRAVLERLRQGHHLHEPEGIDPWPTDEDMAEMCGCGHMLGQHHYGDDLAPCHECTTCPVFHAPGACGLEGHDHGGPR